MKSDHFKAIFIAKQKSDVLKRYTGFRVHLGIPTDFPANLTIVLHHCNQPLDQNEISSNKLSLIEDTEYNMHYFVTS